MLLNTAKSRANSPARPNKIVTAAEAVRLIHDGNTVATGGFVGIGFAEGVAIALEQRFLDSQAATGIGSPRQLTLVYAAGQGDRALRGVNHFGHAGLLKRVIGGHWISAPRLGALVLQNEIEAWNLPQGVIAHLYRAIAGGKPGVVTRIGLHTFVDPRHDGGRLTPRTAQSAIEPRVQRVTLGGEEQLFYPSLPIDVALLRATTADENGNLSCEQEPFHHDLLAIAQAARNSGGRVIAQGTPDEVAADDVSADAAVTEAQLLRDLRLLVGADAILVIRVAVEGFSQAEAGVELGLSEAAARKRYQRATQRLRDALQRIH